VKFSAADADVQVLWPLSSSNGSTTIGELWHSATGTQTAAFPALKVYVSSIPEPATFLMLLGGGGTLGLLRKLGDLTSMLPLRLRVKPSPFSPVTTR
jgi:hypothetical protein